MTDYQLSFPVDSEVFEKSESTFTRVGKDGTIPVFSLFGGDYFYGEVLAGKWNKCNCLDMTGFIGRLTTNGSLELTGAFDGADTSGTAWIYSHSKVLLLDDLLYRVQLEVPSAVTADKVVTIYNILTDEICYCDDDFGTVDPLQTSDYLSMGLRNNNGTYQYSLYKRINNASAIAVKDWTQITNPRIVMDLSFYESKYGYEYTKLQIEDGGTICAGSFT